MATHTDKAYEAELRDLREKLLEMGGLVEAAFFFTDTATPETYALFLHGALPILTRCPTRHRVSCPVFATLRRIPIAHE